jgi:hypothetical protein
VKGVPPEVPLQQFTGRPSRLGLGRPHQN